MNVYWTAYLARIVCIAAAHIGELRLPSTLSGWGCGSATF
jgi:hypothetical protein